jgi:hypothetical protein
MPANNPGPEYVPIARLLADLPAYDGRLVRTRGASWIYNGHRILLGRWTGAEANRGMDLTQKRLLVRVPDFKFEWRSGPILGAELGPALLDITAFVHAASAAGEDALPAPDLCAGGLAEPVGLWVWEASEALPEASWFEEGAAAGPPPGPRVTWADAVRRGVGDGRPVHNCWREVNLDHLRRKHELRMERHRTSPLLPGETPEARERRVHKTFRGRW